MGRPATLPRKEIDGTSYIEIHRAETLRKLEVDRIPTREMLSAVVSRYDQNLALVREFFEFQTRQSLRIEDEGNETVWYVRDTRYASAENKSLTRKAERFEKLLVERTNEYADMLVEAYIDVPDENR